MFYFVLSLGLYITYWVDKVTFVKLFKRPISYDEKPIYFIVTCMKFGILLHMLVGAYMYSNEKIFDANKNVDELF